MVITIVAQGSSEEAVRVPLFNSAPPLIASPSVESQKSGTKAKGLPMCSLRVLSSECPILGPIICADIDSD